MFRGMFKSLDAMAHVARGSVRAFTNQAPAAAAMAGDGRVCHIPFAFRQPSLGATRTATFTEQHTNNTFVDETTQHRVFRLSFG